MKEYLKELRELIILDTANDTLENEHRIIPLYDTILSNFDDSYTEYRDHIPHLLSTTERYFDKSLVYSLFRFLNLFPPVIEYPVTGTFDLSILKIEPDEYTLDKAKQVIEKSLKKNKAIRISEVEIDTEGLSEFEIKQIISLFFDKLQHDSINLNWDYEKIDSTIFSIAWLRSFCKSVGEVELFYHMVNIFIDRLHTSEFNQPARDLCEELLLASFNDNLQTYGFFICFRVYSNQASIQAGLIYGNLCLISLYKKKTFYNYRFKFELIWQSMKFFRNCKMHRECIEIYKKLPSDLHLDNYENQSLDNVYYHSRISSLDKTVVNDLYDYLNLKREDILKDGPPSIIPWLIVVYNLKRLDRVFNYTGSGLDQHLNLFEAIVPPEIISKQRDVILGDSAKLKSQLKESLLKLMATRNKSDYVYDNEMAVMIASRLAEDCIAKKDAEALLLAMMVKSDFSINFITKETYGIAQIEKIETDPEKFYQFYQNPVEQLKGIPIEDGQRFIFLIASEEKLFEITYDKQGFQFYSLPEWKSKSFNNWIKTELPKIEFDTTAKDKFGSVITLVTEDFENDAIRINKGIPMPLLRNATNLKRIIFVNDMRISEFPHNLFKDENDKFIGLTTSVTNTLSIDWLNEKISNRKLREKDSRSIFIPIESGDFTITMLYEFLKDTFDKHEINVFTSLKDFTPLNCKFNIVSSHGGEDIRTTQMLYPDDDHAIYNLDAIIGQGSVLILLVCHSGSAKESYFRNEVDSLAKQYLSKGYEAVIAPFWSLHVNIPPIWLPTFFDALKAGDHIDQAVLKANKAVFEKYPTPAAWGCMHLYGNPFFQ